jgi:hypothetical protein
MSTSKPPRPEQKTLMGMPSDMQAALKKLEAERLNAQGQAPTPTTAEDLQRTMYGNPHAGQSSEPRARPATPLPPFAPAQPFVPPSPARPFTPPPTPARSARSTQASMNRTLVGMPSELQAAVEQARQIHAREQAASRAAQSTPAPVPVMPNALIGHSPSAKPPALPAARRTAAQPTPTPKQQPAATSATGVGSATAFQKPAPAAPSPRAAPAPRATSSGVRPSPTPPTAARADIPLFTAARPQPAAANVNPTHPLDTTEADRVLPENSPPSAAHVSASVASSVVAPGSAAAEMGATRLVSFEEHAQLGAHARQAGSHTGGLKLETSTARATGQQLSLNVSSSESAPAPVKRWPALSLIGLAIVAFGVVVVVRAPGLLPPQIAALLGVAVRAPETAPAAADPNALPPGPDLAPADPADTAQAPPVDPAGSTPPIAADPVPVPADPAAQVAPAASASVVRVEGAAAELEKQAIDALLANQFPTAKGLYERLRAAEPARPEYAVMLELLNRGALPSCGEPGQPECATP